MIESGLASNFEACYSFADSLPMNIRVGQNWYPLRGQGFHGPGVASFAAVKVSGEMLNLLH